MPGSIALPILVAIFVVAIVFFGPRNTSPGGPGGPFSD